MQPVLGLLFDKDGTLFDFNATWNAWAHGCLSDLSGGNVALAGQLGDAIGYDYAAMEFDAASPVIAGTPDEVAKLMLPLLPGTQPLELITRMNTAAAQAPMQPAVPLAPLLDDFLHRGLKLGVATNDAEEPARAHLAAAGVAARFDFIAGCDSGFGAKPRPGQLMGFADAVDLDPRNILMIGDSRHDLSAGRTAGMGTVGVLSGLAGEDDLSDLADVVLPDIGHLPEYLTARAG